jgi:cytochrome c oxidase subunit IV
VAWLLALTPCAVIAVKFGFLVTMGLAVLQAALISMVLMRDAWERRIHLLVIGVGVLLSAFLMAMIAFDRSEYRADVERFDTTIRGVWESGAD